MRLPSILGSEPLCVPEPGADAKRAEPDAGERWGPDEPWGDDEGIEEIDLRGAGPEIDLDDFDY